MIIGHERQYALLAQGMQDESLHHAYLFIGVEGIGKKEVACALARLLLCQGARAHHQACQKCASCALSLLHHPDMHMFSFQEHDVSIDDIRNLKKSLSLGATFGGARVVIIDDAHMLNRESANALLKLLEEPSHNVYFFLISHHPEQISKTIRSRMHIVRFLPLSRASMQKNIRLDLSGVKAALVQAMANGRVGFATVLGAWFEDEKNFSAFNNLIKIIAGQKLFLWAEWQSYIESETPNGITFEMLIEEALHLVIALRCGTLDEAIVDILPIISQGQQIDIHNFLNTIRASELARSTRASKRLLWEHALWGMGIHA